MLVTHDLVVDIAQRKFLNICTDESHFAIPFLGGLGFTRTAGGITGRYNGSDYQLATRFG